MTASFSSRENHVRELGKHFESGVAKGDPLPRAPFEFILRLPRSEMLFLKDTIFSLCEARLGGGDKERASRLQDAGASLIRFLGLTFDADTINRELVPRVIDSAESVSDLPLETVESRISRYERISALAQLAPRISDEVADDVFKAALGMAGYQGAFHPDLLLPLANFERVYRGRVLEGEESSAARCRYLCLESVRGVLETTVEALADADQKSLSDAMGILPLVHTAGLTLLTILPSVSRVGDTECASKMGEILDHSEWLLSRHQRFPGNYVKREEIARFDRVRGMLSLAVGLLSMYSEGYRGVAQEMKVAKREGNHLLGTIVLDLARYAEPDEALELMRELAVEQLRIDASREGRAMNTEAIMETAALAWHIDVGDSPEVRGVFRIIRDPRCQFYLTKAMEGTPWGDGGPR